MDIGMMAIHLTGGVATVARCEDAPHGMRFVPATNAADLAAVAHHVLEGLGVDLGADGLYVCPEELITMAQFPPLPVPADAISFGTARTLLYPDVAPNTGWQRVKRDVEAGRLRAYLVGQGIDSNRYVSRAEVMQLRDEQHAPTPA